MADYMTAKGWLTAAEREWLKGLAQGVPADGWILNIGIEFGASLVCLREGNPTAHLIGIDLIGDSKLAQPVKGLIAVKGDSNVIAEGWERADLVFVDGGHDYNTVLADATLWGLTLMEGGVIAFHDCFLSPAAEAVNTAVERWLLLQGALFQEFLIVDSIRTFRRKTIDG